jgi:DNA polymerase-3 subunit gamma/tau
MAFYQKYRPQKFSDLIGQDHIRKTLITAIKQDRLTHAYLLCGPRGTGKTTTARLLAKSINCPNVQTEDKSKEAGEPCNECELCQSIAAGRSLDVIEIDAASHTGVDDIRDLIEKARLAPSIAKKKVYIIDEAHMLSKSAFNALLKTLEEPPPHVIFILATTEPHKLPTTILSRTQRYDFKRVTKEHLVTYLTKVAKAENIDADTSALELIALAAAGGHRDAVGLLEQVSGYSQKVAEADVENVLGLIRGKKIFDFIGAIFDKQAEAGLKIAHDALQDGIDMVQFHREVLETMRKILVLSICGRTDFEDTEENIKQMEGLGTRADKKELVRVIEIFIQNGKLFKEVSNPILPIEMAIVEASSNSIEGCEGESAGNSNLDLSARQSRIAPSQNVIAAAAKPTENLAGNKGSAILATDSVKIPRASSNAEASLGNLHQHSVKEGDSATTAKETSETNSTTIKQSNNDEAAAPVFEMTADIWNQVIVATKKENATLAALLRDARPISINGSEIMLGVKFKFHQDRISDVKNRQILEKVVEGIMNAKYLVRCELSDFKKPKQEEATDDELQAAVGEVFEVS